MRHRKPKKKCIFILHIIVLLILILSAVFAMIRYGVPQNARYDGIQFSEISQIIFYGIALAVIFIFSAWIIFSAYNAKKISNFKKATLVGLSVMIAVVSWVFYLINFIGPSMGFGAIIYVFYGALSFLFFIMCTLLGLALIKLKKHKFAIAANVLAVIGHIFMIFISLPVLIQSIVVA